MKVCGICGTDIEKIKGESATPLKLGHEAAGVIADVGEKVTEFKVGDRVFIHHHVPCYTCYYCRRGDYTMCDEFPKSNLDPCGMAEYFRVPETNIEKNAVLKLPSEVGFDEAALIEPIACCIRGLNKVKFNVGDDVLIVGAGPIGLIMISLLKMLGAGSIIVSEIAQFRLSTAKKLGADLALNPIKENLEETVHKVTDGRGVDLAVVAVGSVKAVSQALDALRKGGQLLLFGSPPTGSMLVYDANKIFLKELKIIPSYSTTEIETNIVLKLLKLKKIDALKMISHRFKLEEAEKALKLAAESDKTLKVLIYS
ncbi:alcohol dehydrogenase catalytic domain-containing protein [Candidatus Bathyarchaeota archaeon]|nr:alcohol dehydrogenase catalytic domain-containing protein [Candidatus Bathyarchaeota archaeon]